MRYLKFAAMVAATVISAMVAALSGDETITAVEWMNIALAGAGAVGVVVVPNLTGGVAAFAKGIVAVLMAVLTLAASQITDGLTTTEMLQLLVAALGALGVLALKGPQHPSNQVAW